MDYICLTLTIPAVSREAVINKVMELGGLGVVERPADILAYLPEALDIENVRAELEGFRKVLAESGLDPGFSYALETLPSQDWNASWKKGFVPIPVGESLAILPPWEKPPEGRLGIIVDPGMAFGTGHHETTRTCLELIESAAPKHGGGRFLDVGTGTGVLAIAAAALGFAEAVGIDTDPLAVEAASRNASLNSACGVTILRGDISAAAGTYDMIVANLISGVLIDIARQIAERLRPGGVAVLSGMLAGQEHDVIRAAEHAGLMLKERITDGKWVTLVMTRSSTAPA